MRQQIVRRTPAFAALERKHCNQRMWSQLGNPLPTRTARCNRFGCVGSYRHQQNPFGSAGTRSSQRSSLGTEGQSVAGIFDVRTCGNSPSCVEHCCTDAKTAVRCIRILANAARTIERALDDGREAGCCVVFGSHDVLRCRCPCGYRACERSRRITVEIAQEMIVKTRKVRIGHCHRSSGCYWLIGTLRRALRLAKLQSHCNLRLCYVILPSR